MVVEDFKDSAGNYVKSFGSACAQHVTKSYRRWNSLMQRCKEGSAMQLKCPTYRGCTTSALFSDFQQFTNWHVKQVGYGEQCFAIDKDLLIHGNRVYSESVCVLIPKQLNSFLTASTASRGAWPQGVTFHRQHQRFCAQINIGGNHTHIGYYPTPEAASAAYKVAKEAESIRWYHRLRAGEFIVDPRVIERMRVWTFEM